MSSFTTSPPTTTDPNLPPADSTVWISAITTVTSTPLPTNSQNSGGGSSSNIAAIAGGVGGALGLLAIVITIFFVLGQRKRKNRIGRNTNSNRHQPELLGGDAARPGVTPDMGFVGAKVAPFQFHPGVGQQGGYEQQGGYGQHGVYGQQGGYEQQGGYGEQRGYGEQGGYGQYQQMAQQPGMLPPVMIGGSGHGRSDAYSSTTGSYQPSTVTNQSITGMQNTDFRGPSPDPSLGTSATRSSRGRGSASERGRLYIANDDRGEGGSGQGGGSGGGGGGVVQHRDGGPLQEETVLEETDLDEIPPSYDSISPDRNGAAGRS